MTTIYEEYGKTVIDNGPDRLKLDVQFDSAGPGFFYLRIRNGKGEPQAAIIVLQEDLDLAMDCQREDYIPVQAPREGD